MPGRKPSRRRKWAKRALAALAATAVVGGLLIWRQWSGGNFGVVVPGQVYRSAQPTADELRQWSRKYGLKTVVNLRGDSDSKDAALAAAVSESGLTVVEATCSAKHLPSAVWVARMAETLETAQRPMLIHCLDGADRTGVASVMAAMAVGGESFAQARKQLSLKYGHIQGGPGRIGEFLDAYEKHCRDKGLSTGGWREFRTWATEVYHREFYKVEIVGPKEILAGSGSAVPVELTVINRSDVAIPADERLMSLACFEGTSRDGYPDREFGARPELPRRKIAPGQCVTITYLLRAPAEAGERTVYFDLVEEGQTFFGRQGSPTPSCRLIVSSAMGSPAEK